MFTNNKSLRRKYDKRISYKVGEFECLNVCKFVSKLINNCDELQTPNPQTPQEMNLAS